MAFECYYLLSFCTEPMFTAATALLPRNLVLNPDLARKLVRVIIGSACVVGVGLTVVAYIATNNPIFTHDPAVLLLLKRVRWVKQC